MPNLMSTMVGTYDPGKVDVLIGDEEVFGFAEGTMVTIEKNEPLFNTHVGVKGETSRVVNRDNNYTMTIRLQQNSPFIDKLEKWKALDGVHLVPPVVPIVIKDRSGYEGFIGANGWLIEDPSREWGSDHGVREYTFFIVGGFTGDDDIDIALNLAANYS